MGEQPDDYEVLKTPIPTDDPLSIMKIASESEALSYQVATKLLSCENQLAAIEHRITVERMKTIVDNSGDKVAVSASKADAAVAGLKFSEVLPRDLAIATVAKRLADHASASWVACETRVRVTDT